MPRGDRTGPAGAGPMTGRAAGFCTGNSVPGYANSLGGQRFWGRCGGGRRGWRNWFNFAGLPGWNRTGLGFYGPRLTAEEEVGSLKQQAEFLQNDLNLVNERIKQLEKENKT